MGDIRTTPEAQDQWRDQHETRRRYVQRYLYKQAAERVDKKENTNTKEKQNAASDE